MPQARYPITRNRHHLRRTRKTELKSDLNKQVRETEDFETIINDYDAAPHSQRARSERYWMNGYNTGDCAADYRIRSHRAQHGKKNPAVTRKAPRVRYLPELPHQAVYKQLRFPNLVKEYQQRVERLQYVSCGHELLASVCALVCGKLTGVYSLRDTFLEVFQRCDYLHLVEECERLQEQVAKHTLLAQPKRRHAVRQIVSAMYRERALASFVDDDGTRKFYYNYEDAELFQSDGEYELDDYEMAQLQHSFCVGVWDLSERA
eukprot:TRINITY_DN3587_c2_g2_i3.p1 TRINITY_DN3587_c2_g2~~TRINITY_DN3587_c2_g2_i3.p1  ORF type:complete len:262 (+),score=56.55 TRINITY_DN3587_c2_g2_i3:146-931(+)